MPEWWTYRPSDFLMYSPRIYWRLFASINEAWWPAQPVVMALALPLLARFAAHRHAALALALAWSFVAWAFLWARFAPINWPAQAYAIGFALQAALLLALGVRGGLRAVTAPLRRHGAAALVLWAVLGQPLLAPAFARPWSQAEVFGFAPDPTAIATLGWLLAVEGDGASRGLLRTAWVVASAWLLVTAATLATMGTWQAAVPLSAVVTASCLALMSIPDLRRSAAPGVR